VPDDREEEGEESGGDADEEPDTDRAPVRHGRP
jgi:hypothetical protein